MKSNFPKVDKNYFTEREGILAVERIVNQMSCIWRETPNKDVGIDGQIEYVDEDGNTTGHVIAVQVKSGKSFIHEKDGHIIFYPEHKHLQYWENYALPVILLIYDPENNIAYWKDIRRKLRSESQGTVIKIPITQIFNISQKNQVFESCGALGLKLLPHENIVYELLHREFIDYGFVLSFFDLFINGIVDIGRKLFFSIDLCSIIVEFNNAKSGQSIGASYGMYEYDFIDQYIIFLVSQNLAVIDYSDYLIDKERYITPMLLVPLTTRGRAVHDLIRELGHIDDGHALTETIIGITDWSFELKLNAHIHVKNKINDKLKKIKGQVITIT